MAVHLIVAEQDGGHLKKASLSALTAAKKIEGQCIGLCTISKVIVLGYVLPRITNTLEGQCVGLCVGKNKRRCCHNEIVAR